MRMPEKPATEPPAFVDRQLTKKESLIDKSPKQRIAPPATFSEWVCSKWQSWTETDSKIFRVKRRGDLWIVRKMIVAAVRRTGISRRGGDAQDGLRRMGWGKN
jgi:hypothetical protein